MVLNNIFLVSVDNFDVMESGLVLGIRKRPKNIFSLELAKRFSYLKSNLRDERKNISERDASNTKGILDKESLIKS